mmetsp:Transcript_3800/g.11771  ORF Transcript_3800/g.11771 Transcript_3800/m.11771 type:complete len:116 (-) Transcript_3800:164-511(-)
MSRGCARCAALLLLCLQAAQAYTGGILAPAGRVARSCAPSTVAMSGYGGNFGGPAQKKVLGKKGEATAPRAAAPQARPVTKSAPPPPPPMRIPPLPIRALPIGAPPNMAAAIAAI